MPEQHSDLIYDIGLCDGADTAYYLFRGYNVVAVDANPVMVERARLRFDREIRDNRLTLLNVGIAEAPGTATFWISDQPEWSSFDRTIASRCNVGHGPVEVAVVPFAQIIAEHGVPHYLKIDIEGNDRICVAALQGGKLPRYLSVEAECVGDSVVLADAEATAMLELLRDLGYRKFKLVDQSRGWTPVRSSAMARYGMRVVTRAAQSRFPGLSAIARRFTDPTRVARLGFDFTLGSSGPWGEDVPGAWMPFDKARAAYLRERHAYFVHARPLFSFWHDWHATF